MLNQILSDHLHVVETVIEIGVFSVLNYLRLKTHVAPNVLALGLVRVFFRDILCFPQLQHHLYILANQLI